MNVIQYQDLLKQTLQGYPYPELVIPITDLELETRNLPITLPKTAWKLLDSFEMASLQHTHIISSVQLFEEVIIANLLTSNTAIMTQIVKVGD